jgi:hypothetical protein
METNETRKGKYSKIVLLNIARTSKYLISFQTINKNRKHINFFLRKLKVFKKKLKHEPNIVEITHLCIRHGVHTSSL